MLRLTYVKSAETTWKLHRTTGHLVSTTRLEIPAHRLEDLEAERHDGLVRRCGVEQQRFAEVSSHSQDELFRPAESGAAAFHNRREHLLRNEKSTGNAEWIASD